MSKVGILTFQGAENCGASLQAYALQSKIEELNSNIKVSHINYQNFEITNKKNPMVQRGVKNKLIRATKNLVFKKVIKSRSEAFNKFDEDYINLTKPYTHCDLRTINEDFDTFIVGSDQVFNTEITGFDENFLLTFVTNRNKYAYAASFGDMKFYEDSKDMFNEHLSAFNGITFREEVTTETLDRELPGMKISTVLDPTLLLDLNFWEEMFPKISTRPMEDRYVVVYSVNPSEKTFAYAKNVAKQNGLKVVYLNTGYRPQPGVINIFDFGPTEFMQYIKNADYTMVTSFHGLVFSIIFNRQFAIETMKNSSAGSVRLTSLLNDLNIQHRDLSQSENPLTNSINYELVNERLENLRNVSVALLREWIH